MPLLTLRDAELAFGLHPLLDGASLTIGERERIGLIGRNGTGKSSLLRIIEGVAPPDDGTVWKAPALKLAAVAQEPSFEAGQSIFDAVASGVGEARQLLVDYHAAAHAGDLARLARLHESLDRSGGWALEHRPWPISLTA